jgi:2-C-methyl-D-erythritol 4-phosphate cytidylyltransferase / 2-C-methyl-D-erythritol 2,4-cyclodiphosphate synthase
LSNSTEIAVVIVAAGRGERAGGREGPKQYRLIGGKSVLGRSLMPFSDEKQIGRIVIVRHSDDEALYVNAISDATEPVISVIGGATRQASVLNGLNALADNPPRYVLIHDAARPFVDAAMLTRIIEALSEQVGVLPAISVTDTLKRANDEGMVLQTIDRKQLYGAQTPQGFPFGLIHKAHMKAAQLKSNAFTDDASIAEWAGLPVKIILGSSENAKLTWKRDIEMADQKLSAGIRFPDVRTGNGYDVHSFVEGDFVTLGGVKIAHNAALNGHSDSDVALHALTDALLATCGAGDIGTHFPPSDMQWKGVASRIFVEHAVGLIHEKGGRIANVDVTLICEAPKIGPHRNAMVAAISSMTGLSLDRISIKATTNEKLGSIGRGEGIAAIATTSVVFSGELQ